MLPVQRVRVRRARSRTQHGTLFDRPLPDVADALLGIPPGKLTHLSAGRRLIRSREHDKNGGIQGGCDHRPGVLQLHRLAFAVGGPAASRGSRRSPAHTELRWRAPPPTGTSEVWLLHRVGAKRSDAGPKP